MRGSRPTWSNLLDKPLEEVAGILGIPVGTAASRLHRALRILRAKLDHDDRRTSREVAG